MYIFRAAIRSFNPEPGTAVNSGGPTPASVRIACSTTPARESTPTVAHRRDREMSDKVASNVAGLAAGSGLNDLSHSSSPYDRWPR
jgi:hypothetical protein